MEIGITPKGSLTGSSLVKTNNLPVVLVSGLLLGFFISIAEPGLMVLAYQVDFVTLSAISSWTLLIVVSIGLAIMVSLGFLRVVLHVSLKIFLLGCYLVIFVMAFFAQPEFLAIAFDASGATTGIRLSFSSGLAVEDFPPARTAASERRQFWFGAIASAEPL